MHIAEVVTIAKSLPLLRLNTYKSLILSYSADYRRIFGKKREIMRIIRRLMLFIHIITGNLMVKSIQISRLLILSA